MSAALISTLRRVCRVLADTPDSELLHRFAKQRDGEAFAELVRRYGPVVYRVCRRTADPGAADDAFQATFLVLARRADAASASRSVGGWLLGVAGWEVRQANRAARRRSRHEVAFAQRADTRTEPPDENADYVRVLDEELVRLPDRLRGPVVLCLLRDRTQDEAAAELGCTARTVRRRLDEAKRLLRVRLEKRGVIPAVAAGLVAGVGPVTATVPGRLCTAVVTAALSGEVPASVAQLLSGVKLMSLPFLWRPVVAAVVVIGGTLSVAPNGAADPRANPVPRVTERVVFRTAAVAPAPRPVKLVLWESPNRVEGIPPNIIGQADDAVFTPSGSHVLTPALVRTGSELETRGVIRVRDVVTGKVVRDYRGTARNYATVAISPDGKTMAAAGSRPRPGQPGKADCVIEVWDWGGEKPRLELVKPLGLTPDDIGGVPTLAFSPDGKSLAAVDMQATVYSWNLAAGKRAFRTVTLDDLKNPGVGRSRYAALRFSADGKTLITADDLRRVRTLDAVTGKLREAIETRYLARGAFGVALSPDRRAVAIGQVDPHSTTEGFDLTWAGVIYDLPIKLSDGAKGRPLRIRKAPKVKPDGTVNIETMCRMAFSPDGKWVAGIGPGNGGKAPIRVFHAATGSEVAVVQDRANDSAVRLAFSPDGKTLLLSGSETVELWSVEELLKRKPE